MKTIAILVFAMLFSTACGPGLRDGCSDVADGYRLCRFSSCHIILQEKRGEDWVSITDSEYVINVVWVIDNKIKLLGGRAATKEQCKLLLKNKNYEEFMLIEMNH